MSSLIAVTSIPTDNDLSQLGQSYERAFQDFAGCTALMTLRLTWVNSVLQCGHKLIDSPSLVGSGVEIASYREGGSHHCPGHSAPRERHNNAWPGRALTFALRHEPHSYPITTPADGIEPAAHPHERDHVRRAIPH